MKKFQQGFSLLELLLSISLLMIGVGAFLSITSSALRITERGEVYKHTQDIIDQSECALAAMSWETILSSDFIEISTDWGPVVCEPKSDDSRDSMCLDARFMPQGEAVFNFSIIRSAYDVQKE